MLSDGRVSKGKEEHYSAEAVMGRALSEISANTEITRRPQ